MRFIFGGQKRRLMVIEPPCQTSGRRVFEIDNSVFVAVEHRFVKEVAFAVKQARIIYRRVFVYARAVKACEDSGGRDAVEAMAVIKYSEFHNKICNDAKFERMQKPAILTVVVRSLPETRAPAADEGTAKRFLP